MIRLLVSFFCVIYGLAACGQTPEETTARIAVATNFKPAMAALESRFEAETGYDIETVTGSTGALYAQITQGAPFDVFLAADQERPQKLEESGHAVQGTRFTYAVGQLVLWSAASGQVGLESLREPQLLRLAIANPELAPYGRAAQGVIEELGLQKKLQHKLVLGENIGQTFAFIKTGNAELGFVAFSQVLSLPKAERGTSFPLERRLYRPIRQDAQLLKRGSDNMVALAFIDFLRSQGAADIIASAGYISP